jgi:ATP-dependent DNA ligase
VPGEEGKPLGNRLGLTFLPVFPNYQACVNKLRTCLPTRGTKVPAHADWVHEIKHDGDRMIVQRDGDRVRLFTRNGRDWTSRYPLIVEAALRNRTKAFVIDGEAVSTRGRRNLRFQWPTLPPA